MCASGNGGEEFGTVEVTEVQNLLDQQQASCIVTY
jgi:hypothetical protein